MVVVEEKGWERRKGSESLPGAGTGQGRGLHSETQSPAAQPGEIPLCVASPAPALHTMSARSALILRGLPGTPFQGLKLSTLGFTSTEIPYFQQEHWVLKHPA